LWGFFNFLVSLKLEHCQLLHGAAGAVGLAAVRLAAQIRLKREGQGFVFQAQILQATIFLYFGFLKASQHC
jgi:hypothetical protein